LGRHQRDLQLERYPVRSDRRAHDAERRVVYEFALQLHAIQFWDRFDGRWLRHGEFMFPDKPIDLPKLKEPREPNRFDRSRRER
jgi:hypothetical protein